MNLRESMRKYINVVHSFTNGSTKERALFFTNGNVLVNV